MQFRHPLFVGAQPRKLAYPDIQVMDVVRRFGLSSATFYTIFSAKSAWATAVLDVRLNETLDRQRAPEHSTSPARRERVLASIHRPNLSGGRMSWLLV